MRVDEGEEEDEVGWKRKRTRKKWRENEGEQRQFGVKTRNSLR